MKELILTKEFINKNTLNNVFIPTGNNWNSTEGKTKNIIESGKEGLFFNQIIDAILNAKSIICLQSFLIQDTKIIDALLKVKQEKNVKIFILDAAEARLASKIEEDNDYKVEDYRKMLIKKFKDNFVHRQASNLHAKFILIDPKTNPSGYIFTGNFNKKPFFENPELAVSLSKSQIKELFRIFVYHFWEHTTDEQTNNNEFKSVKPINKFNLPQLKNILITSPNSKASNLKITLLNAVQKAEQEIQFSTFGFDITNDVSKEILKKLKSGIKVTVFCKPRTKTIKNNMEILSKHGATIYCQDLLHAKSLIIDNKEAFIFSANFETQGLETGFEVGVKLSISQTKELLNIYKNWENTFPYIYKSELKIAKTDQYLQFEKGRFNNVNMQRIKKLDKKSDRKKIRKVTELLNYFKNLKEPQISKFQKTKIEKIAIFENLKNYKEKKKLNYWISEIEIIRTSKKDNKIIKAVLLDLSKEKSEENIRELLKLIDNKAFLNLAVYCKN